MQASIIKTNIWNMYIVEVKTVHFRYIAVMYNTTSNKTQRKESQLESDDKPSKDIPYLALTGGLWVYFWFYE